jgi:hypothetical protein
MRSWTITFFRQNSETQVHHGTWGWFGGMVLQPPATMSVGGSLKFWASTGPRFCGWLVCSSLFALLLGIRMRSWDDHFTSDRIQKLRCIMGRGDGLRA